MTTWSRRPYHWQTNSTLLTLKIYIAGHNGDFYLPGDSPVRKHQPGAQIDNPGIAVLCCQFHPGYVISRITRLSYQEGTSPIMTTLARNAPLALTIAVAVFPGSPLIPLVLAVESLIELPILFVLAQLLLLINRNKWWPREGFRQG